MFGVPASRAPPRAGLLHLGLNDGALESAYEACLCAELGFRQMRFERQRAIPICYKGLLVDCGYRVDVIVEDRILLELKSVERLLPIQEAQVVTYLRLADLPVGLLVNVNVSVLRTGLRRLTREHPKIFRPSDLPVDLKVDDESACHGRRDS